MSETYVTPLSWPPWIELQILNHTEVRITVTHGPHTHSWIGERGNVANRETLNVARQVYAGLVQKQKTIDAVTTKLNKR
jgi:hypothetical protein